MDASTPHLMNRARPGDKRCSVCGMTAGTKAHRAGRETAAVQVQATDQVDTVDVQVPAVNVGRWVVKGTNRTVTNPSQVDIVRGSVVRAPVGATPDQDRNAVTSETVNDHADQGDEVPATAGETEETTMRATVNRADLVAALTYAGKGVPARPSVPALAGIVITVAGDTLTAHTFDWDTVRSADVPATDVIAGRAAVGGKTLIASVKAMKAKSLTVVATAGELTVSGPDESVALPLFPIEDMPAVPAGEHVIGTIDAATLARLAGTVAVAASVDETVPNLCTVRVRTKGNRIDLAATDRYRLHTAAGTWSPATDDDGYLVAPGSEYLVPAKLLSEVTALMAKRASRRPATVTITAGMMRMHESMSPDAVYGLECGGYRMLTRPYTASEYPPVDRLFPASPAGTVTVAAGDLVDKITAVSGGAKRTDALPVILVMDTAAGTITLEYWADDAGHPSSVATMPATYAGTVPDEVGLRALYTVDALAGFVTGAGATVTLEFVTATKPMVITGNAIPGTRNLVMPIRISGMPDHAFKVSATDETRCDVMGCTGDRTARVHTRAARQPAAEVPAPAVESIDQGDQAASDSDAVSVPVTDVGPDVELSGPIVASVDEVPLHSGTAVVANGGTFGYIATAKRLHGTAGFNVMTGGQFTTHYATSSLRPAVIGATVCDKPYLSCSCARRMHLSASDLRRLPRIAGDQAASVSDAVSVPAPAVDVPAVPTDHPFTLPSHLVATYEALYAVALAAGFQPNTLWTRAGTSQTADDKWTTRDGVTLQIGTRAGYHGAGKSHVVVSWHSWNDVVTVQPGAALHTIDQVRDYLAGYMDAVTTCRFGSDGLERIYRAVTDNHNPYGTPLPRRPFSAAPAPADFDRYAAEIKGCVCPLCVALVAAVDSGDGRDDAARALFTALYGTHKAPTHVRTVADQGAPAYDSAPAESPAGDQDAPEAAIEVAAVPAAAVPAPAVETVDQGDQGTAVSVPVEAPAAPRKRDPKRALRSLVGRLSPAGTVTSVDIDAATGRVSIKGTRPTDEQVSRIMGEAYRFVQREAGIVGHYDRFMPVARIALCGHRSEHQEGATCGRPAGHLPANIHSDDNGAHWFPYGVHTDGTVDPGTSPEFAARVASQDSAPADTRDAEQAPAPASVDEGNTDAVTDVSGPGHPLAIDPGEPVTVTLVYSDRPTPTPAVPAVEAPAGDQVPALAGDETHGAHAQRVHVSGAGELDGHRFHLVAGVGCRQFAKPIRRALAGQFGHGVFHVTTPSGSGAVNVAASGDVADWSPVLALVAGIIGDKIASDSAGCATCDRSRALADS